MKFETSSKIPANEITEIEKKLRQAAVEAKSDKFFGPNEKIEVVNNPSSPSVDELAKKASGEQHPMGDPTFCLIAYTAAIALCDGDATCKAIAGAAYQICLHSK